MCRHGKNIVMPLTCMARRRAAATSTSSIPAQSHAAAPLPVDIVDIIDIIDMQGNPRYIQTLLFKISIIK